MFEQRQEPPLTRTAFLLRMAGSFGLTLLIVAASLIFGGAGYHYFGDLPWLDALLNAAMILTGMGPVDPMHTAAGKVFAIVYALYSGIAFLSMIAVLMAPIIHRVLHRFHYPLDDAND